MVHELIENRHPATVGQLASILAEVEPFDEVSYVDTIKSMIKDGSLKLGRPSYEIYTPLDYLLYPTVSGWFWSVLALVCVATLIVYVVPGLFPLGILRWVFGSILLFLPGYATIRLLFPFSELHFYEKLALSGAVSLAIIPTVGFVLNFTPWGIRFLPILASLAAYTIVTVTAAASRSYFTVVQRPD